jgi:phosphoribosylformimino-5-aminoimidazole carboxamide ribotide isomerase
VALQFENAGLKRLHLVDLDGAKAGRVKNWKVLEQLAARTSLSIDFGGGIKTAKDVQIVFDSGAELATVGSIAVKDEELLSSWLVRFGAQRFFLGADVRKEKITVSGWMEQTELWVYDFIKKFRDKGIFNIFCTDVEKDGAMEGPSLDLYKNIISKFPDIHFVASGGVSSIDDVQELQQAGCAGVIIGKAIYEGKIRLSELKKMNS